MDSEFCPPPFSVPVSLPRSFDFCFGWPSRASACFRSKLAEAASACHESIPSPFLLDRDWCEGPCVQSLGRTYGDENAVKVALTTVRARVGRETAILHQLTEVVEAQLAVEAAIQCSVVILSQQGCAKSGQQARGERGRLTSVRVPARAVTKRRNSSCWYAERATATLAISSSWSPLPPLWRRI